MTELLKRPTELFLRSKFNAEDPDCPSLPMLGKVTYENVATLHPMIAKMIIALFTDYAFKWLDYIHTNEIAGSDTPTTTVLHALHEAFNHERAFHGIDPVEFTSPCNYGEEE